MLDSKVVEFDSKIIILLLQSKSVTHTAWVHLSFPFLIFPSLVKYISKCSNLSRGCIHHHRVPCNRHRVRGDPKMRRRVRGHRDLLTEARGTPSSSYRRPVVNFINILRTTFVRILFCQKMTKSNCN